jgi:hypothetical protein
LQNEKRPECSGRSRSVPPLYTGKYSGISFLSILTMILSFVAGLFAVRKLPEVTGVAGVQELQNEKRPECSGHSRSIPPLYTGKYSG